MSSGGSSSTPGYLFQNVGGLGLGYAIVIALGFLLLLSTVLLASYVCCHSRHRHAPPPNTTDVILPRIVFVSDDEDDDDDDAAVNDGSAVAGLDREVISSYPKFPFSKSRGGGNGGADSVCSICLCDYREGEMLRMLPDCRHSFHLSCIDAWLSLNATCPVCRRTSPAPTPLSTPLSELVPLSHFPADGRR